jgi:hypothetical protein
MAILIKATENKAIKISGTDININEVYGRLEFVGRSNGINLEIGIVTYSNKATFEENKPIYTDVESRPLVATLEAGEAQSIDTAHKYAKLAYEQLGYEVVIDLN